MLDYFEGSEKSRDNSERLEASARIILNDNNSIDSFGLFLYPMAYEEITKAVHCLLIHFDKIKNDKFVNPYFTIMSLKYYYSIKFSILILSVWLVEGLTLMEFLLTILN